MTQYLYKYWKGYLIGFILLIGVNLLAAYIPQLVKQAIDFLPELKEKIQIQENLEQILLQVILLAIVMAALRIYSRQIVFGIGRQVEFDLKKVLFDHIIKFEPKYFGERQTGDLISIITNDVQSLRALAGFAMLNIANTIIAFAVVLPLMFKLHVELTWWFLVLIPTVITFIISLSSKIKAYQQVVQERLGELSSFIEKNLSGIHIIKAYAQEDAEIERFKNQNYQLRDDYIKLVGVRSLIGPVMKVIASFGFVLLLFIGGKAIVNEAFSPGDFAAYALYVTRLIWPVATLGWLITVVYRAQVSQKRIREILDREAKVQDRIGAIDKTKFESQIDLKYLSASQPVSISKGENIAVIGKIASGKTYLANKLMHLVEFNEGEIFIDGIDLKNIKLNSLRSMINLVPQESFLFSTSIAENISYAADLKQEEIEELAKMVNIHDEILKFPEGYQSIVGEKGVTVSGGQRQRLAIARALAINPQVLILDDALSSLDDKTAREILDSILKSRAGKTTIFITHKESIIDVFDKTLVMHELNKKVAA